MLIGHKFQTGIRVILATCFTLLIAPGYAFADEDKVLNVFNWSEYIGDNTVKRFQDETGIKVRYDTFDSNETLLAKMIAGRTGYDIIIPSSDFGKIMIDGELVSSVSKEQLSNWGNLDPDVMSKLSQLDPGNNYMVPWLGGMVVVGYNIDKVKAALGTTPIPADPFELIFNPVYSSKLKKCGISILDAASDVFPSALLYIKKSPFSTVKSDYQEAAAMLLKVRENISLFSSLGYMSDLASGALCVSLGYGGDFENASRRAKEAKNGVHIESPLPPNGAEFGFESMMIPKDAPHPENALKWINFILRPEVQAEITNKMMFMSPNLAARKFIDKDALANPIAFPSSEYLKTKAHFYELRKSEIRRIMNRLFTNFKTGF
jgi:putrescine transport system substrate-binding protein